MALISLHMLRGDVILGVSPGTASGGVGTCIIGYWLGVYTRSDCARLCVGRRVGAWEERRVARD